MGRAYFGKGAVARASIVRPPGPHVSFLAFALRAIQTNTYSLNTA